MSYLLYTICCFFLYAASVYGQNGYSPQIAFKHLTIDNVLPQNTVLSIAQDKNGFMWFATQDGLCRYDGYSVKLFRHDRQDPHSLRNNFVTALIVDKGGTLWVGTAGGGVSAYNRFNNHFTAFIHDPKNPHSLSDNRVQTLYEDRSGMIWIGTEQGGLNLFDSRTGAVRVFVHNPSDAQSLPANRVYSLTQDTDGTVWIATLGGGLCYLNPVDSTFIRVRFDASDRSFSRGTIKSPLQTAARLLPESNNVSALYADKEGFVWVGMRGAGVVRVDARTGWWERVVYDPSPQRYINSNDVYSLCEDWVGRVWIGSEGGGVSLYERSTGKITTYRHEPLNPPSLSDNVVRGLFCDNAGTMWVGTATGGVNKYAANAHRFAVYRHEPLNPRSLAADVVRAFCEDGEGNIWVGAVDGGLDRFVRSEGAFEHHRYTPRNDTALGNEDVWALVAAKDGTLWVGTQNGLFAYRPARAGRSALRKEYRHNPRNPQSLSSNIIRALCIDHEGVLWVGTNLGGLCRFDKTTESFTTYRFPPSDTITIARKDEVLSDHIRDIAEASDGTLWIGTANLGVLAFDKQRGSVKTAYRHNETVVQAKNGIGSGLSNNTVRYIHEDKRGNIWVGTFDGLNCISPETGEIRIFSEENGLPNEVVYGILEDKKGCFWLTTNKGLVRFHPEKRTFKTYTKQDGLQSNEFNGHAVLHGRDGWFYVGGIGGFNTFHPDSIRDNGRIPPVRITDCKVFGKSLLTDTAITEITTLTLPYSQSNCTFEFVALNYIGTEKNQYRYILEGFDTEWMNAGTRRDAIYTNLDPGEYTFRVQGSNNDGVWNMQGTSLRLIITPPWWGTWYFRLGAAMLIIGLGYVTFQARVYTLRQTAQYLEEQVRTRTQVLTETNERLAVANEEVQRQVLQQYEQAQELQKAYFQLDEANEILITRNHELMLLNKEKNDLLGIVSHDLRNPLVSTLLAIKLLHKRFSVISDEEKFAYLEKIQGASEQMIDFITKLLDVNALETGKMPVHLVACHLGHAAEAVIENYQARASAKNITIHYFAISQPMVLADAILLPQVLDNLISNAVKYSPPGRQIFVYISLHNREQASVESIQPSENFAMNQTMNHTSEDYSTRSLASSTIADSQERNVIRLEVQDEGQGFSEAEKSKLFEKFTRLSARPTGGEHSSGLGLSIVKKMVDAMNGRIWCESEHGKGAKFIVEFAHAPESHKTRFPEVVMTAER